jgi:hypothetical protein
MSHRYQTFNARLEQARQLIIQAGVDLDAHQRLTDTTLHALLAAEHALLLAITTATPKTAEYLSPLAGG